MSRKMRTIRSSSAGLPPASVHAASTRSSTASSSPQGASRSCITPAASASLSGVSSMILWSDAAVSRPPIAAGDELGAPDAHEKDRRAQRLDEVGEQIERVVVRPVEVVEDEDDRPPLVRRRIGLEERLDDRAPEEVELLLVPFDGLDERRVEELEPEDLAEEVGDVADLPVLEDRGDLGADLGLRGLGVHPLDDSESSAKRPGEDGVSARLVRRVAPEDSRRRVALRARHVDEKIAHQARLADPRCAEDRDRPSDSPRADVRERRVELPKLGGAPLEHRAARDVTTLGSQPATGPTAACARRDTGRGTQAHFSHRTRKRGGAIPPPRSTSSIGAAITAGRSDSAVAADGP